MIKAEAVKQIHPHDILELMLSADVIQSVIKDVDTFMKRRNGLPQGVLNAILIRTIHVTNGSVFNEAYLRKVTETFKAEGIKTVHSAIEYIERNHDQKRAIERRQRANEPDWLEGYIKDLGKIEG